MVLCTSSGDALDVLIFFNVSNILIPPHDTRSQRIVLHPDATMKIPYKEQYRVQNAHGWETMSPRNIRDTRLVSLMTEASTEEGLDMTTSEWLDIEEIVQAAKLGNTVTQPRGRNVFRYPGALAGSSQTDKMWCIGSKGYREVWVDNLGPQATRRLNVVPTHAPDGDSSDGFVVTNLSRTLHVPIDMNCVYDILGFCDEAAIIALLTAACESGCCRPSVRFFDY